MSNQPLGKANWLHISSHALSLYGREGGALTVRVTPAGIEVLFAGTTAADPAWHPAFLELLRQEVGVTHDAQPE